MKSRPIARITARHLGHRLVVPAEDEAMSRRRAEAERAFPSSVTKTTALELWSDEAIRLLLRLVGRDTPPCRLSRIRLSMAD